jgi:NAD(P)-dependent dehydrogenase (short-subunit alcohol dehydrogenase family)
MGLSPKRAESPTVRSSSAKAPWGCRLSEEFAPAGVRFNSVSPGPVVTPPWTRDGGIGDQIAGMAGVSKEEALSSVAPGSMGLSLGRMLSPEEVAEVVVFLGSRRSAAITGTDYVIDGGMLKSL